jgi:hypothetical protein
MSSKPRETKGSRWRLRGIMAIIAAIAVLLSIAAARSRRQKELATLNRELAVANAKSIQAKIGARKAEAESKQMLLSAEVAKISVEEFWKARVTGDEILVGVEDPPINPEDLERARARKEWADKMMRIEMAKFSSNNDQAPPTFSEAQAENRRLLARVRDLERQLEARARNKGLQRPVEEIDENR